MSLGKMPQNTSSSSSLFGKLSSSTRSSWISPKEVKCTVQLLHDSDLISNEFKRSTLAQSVLDYVCELKNIEERDFLGLRYQDKNKHRYWVDLSKPISHFVKQFKKERTKIGKTEHLSLRLRFRFYPTNPTRLKDQNLRYQLFVQLQRDLLHGRLYCPQSQSAHLAALLLQSQLGDYNPEIHQENYVSGYKLLLKQTPKLEEKIAALHKELIGKSSEDAELEFLEKASQLETYGFDPYTISEPDSSSPVYLGATPKGVLVFVGTQKSHQIPWSELAKVNYSGKEIKLQLKDSYIPPSNLPIVVLNTPAHDSGDESSTPTAPPPTVTTPDETTNNANGTAPGLNVSQSSSKSGKGDSLKYNCPSEHFAKHLWIHLLSQQAFFSEAVASDVKPRFSKPKIPLFSRGSTFRFPARRVYKEIETCPNESAPVILKQSSLNASDTTSVMSTKYELSRQEPRIDQPWLNGHAAKSTTLPIKLDRGYEEEPSCSSSPEENNNKTRRLLEFSLDSPTAQDAISTPSPVYITQTIKNSTKNQTEEEPEVEKKVVQEVESTFRPNSASTPYNNNQVKTNGHTKTNGIAKKEDKEATTTSLVTKALNFIFAVLLIILLTIAVCIAVLEKSEKQPDWVERNEMLSVLRHDYYEPAREFTVHHYRQLIAKRN